jgi:hypothetical protein
MHEVRATYSNRRWTVVATAFLLLLITLWILLREGRQPTVGAARGITVESSPAEESAAEIARRRAIAALGPIQRRNGTNAADLYKQAMALYSQLTEAEKHILQTNVVYHLRPNDPPGKVDPATAAALYAKIQPIMDLLRRARLANYVDWGLDMDSDAVMGSLMGQMHAISDLGQLAYWDSTYRFESDPDGATGDLAAMEALGRSGGNSLWVDINIQSNAIFLLAKNAGDITSAASSDLAYIISPSATEQSFQNTMNVNASILQALLDEYTNPATQSQAEQTLREFDSGSLPALTPVEIVTALTWDIQTQRALASAVTEPEAQFQQWWSQTLAGGSSVPDANTSGLKNIVSGLQASQVESAMLEAGLALEQNNQAQFQSINDPSTGRPFIYTQTANGFQLGSPQMSGGAPVTLSFPAPAAR